jgi:hypothetical protein
VDIDVDRVHNHLFSKEGIILSIYVMAAMAIIITIVII